MIDDETGREVLAPRFITYGKLRSVLLVYPTHPQRGPNNLKIFAIIFNVLGSVLPIIYAARVTSRIKQKPYLVCFSPLGLDGRRGEVG
jgi:hypothetical protein